MKHLLKIFVFSFIAVAIHGYQFAVSDQEIFIPYILKSQDKTLFPGDALFNQSSAYLSFFYPLMGYLTKLFDIQIIFFLGYLVFQFAFFVALYRLSNILLKDKNLAYLSLLPFLLPKFIGGTATQTFDLFFGYRSIGIIFLLLYLSFLLEKKYLKSASFALVGFLFHPLSIIPNILVLPVIFTIYTKPKLKELVKYLILSVVLFSAVTLVFEKDLIASIFLKNDMWFLIIKARDNYLFISTWKPLAWAALFIYPVITLLLINRLKNDMKRSVVIISLVLLAIFTANAILLEVLRLPGFAQFQLVRAITPVAYIALAMSPLFLTFKNMPLKILGLLSFILLSLNLFYLFLISTTAFAIALLITGNQNEPESSKTILYIAALVTVIAYIVLNFNSYLDFQNKIQFPKKQNDWINMQKWVNLNTDKSAKFLVPPDLMGFRIFSSRPIVGDIKDGAVAIYSSSYANYWTSLTEDFKNYQNLKISDFLKLKKNYKFSYFITTADKALNGEIIFRNKSYLIYKI